MAQPGQNERMPMVFQKMDRETYYAQGVSYWDKQEASNRGVLGGYEATSPADVRGSQQLLKLCEKWSLAMAAAGKIPAPLRVKGGICLDGGAGVGRVTKELLAPLGFSRVDLVDPSEHLLRTAHKELRGSLAERGVETRYVKAGLQDLHFRADLDCASAPSQPPATEVEFLQDAGQKYSAIWLQWVLLYPQDDDLVAFLKRAKSALEPGGMIFAKENVSKIDEVVPDTDDCSVTRPVPHYRMLFTRAGLEIVCELKQTGWPSDLFPVHMFALR